MGRNEEQWCSGQVVDAALRVHSRLGPGLLERPYRACLAHELRRRGIPVREEQPIPLRYDGVEVEVAYFADLVVSDTVIVELKAVAKLLPIHTAQLLSYMRMSGLRAGLLLNFHERHLKDGIKRLINDG